MTMSLESQANNWQPMATRPIHVKGKCCNNRVRCCNGCISQVSQRQSITTKTSYPPARNMPVHTDRAGRSLDLCGSVCVSNSVADTNAATACHHGSNSVTETLAMTTKRSYPPCRLSCEPSEVSSPHRAGNSVHEVNDSQ